MVHKTTGTASSTYAIRQRRDPPPANQRLSASRQSPPVPLCRRETGLNREKITQAGGGETFYGTVFRLNRDAGSRDHQHRARPSVVKGAPRPRSQGQILRADFLLVSTRGSISLERRQLAAVEDELGQQLSLRLGGVSEPAPRARQRTTVGAIAVSGKGQICQQIRRTAKKKWRS